MKKVSLIAVAFFIILIPSMSFAVLVAGYCYLQHQINYSGTKALFQANSPTAVTDSTFTDSSGYYWITVQPGVYDVTFSHSGYYDCILENQVLTMSPINLPAQTLISLPIGIPIGGSMSGVLQDTIYIVVGNFVVEMGDSLIIEPGATILFNGAYSCSIDGYLYAVGTETDSIIFAAYETAPHWRGIYISNMSNCHLGFCYITQAIYSGVGIFAGVALIENCSIVNNSSLTYGGGVGIGNSVAPVIRDCLIMENSSNQGGGGIYCSSQSHPTFYNCIIENNTTSGHGGAAFLIGNSYAEFIGCTINSNGPRGEIYCQDTAHPTFINCTIADNWDFSNEGNGIKLTENSYVTLENTIVSNNEPSGITFNGSAGAQCNITYSDFYNDHNFSGTVPNLIGQYMLVNANGDSCDLFYNILLDPMFVNHLEWNFNIQANSPCIDAGNPLSPLDPDGTIADMGALPFNHIPSLTIDLSGTDAILSWQAIGDAEEYRIYYDSNPHFTPFGIPQAVVIPPDTVWTDEDAVLQGKRYYRVVVQY
jgi:predicted outer membrane repeat protein